MKRGKKKAWFYSMPFLIIVGLMIVVPLLYTVEISFTNMSIYHWKDYHCVGLDNYKKALQSFVDLALVDGVVPPGPTETGYPEAAGPSHPDSASRPDQRQTCRTARGTGSPSVLPPGA